MVTVYAGVAFAITELINNITDPLKLPGWTPTLVIILLAIGFPIALIFSWIFDIGPGGELKKTEPDQEAGSEDRPKSLYGWKIASYISFVVIVALILINITPRDTRGQMSVEAGKSIAVLPFINDSPEEENAYFINGVMDAILDNLCKIEGLRVPGRTTMEQYRDAAMAIPAIARELEVGYILSGSGQKIGNRLHLYVQLLNGVNDSIIWSKPYDRVIQEVEDLIDIYSEIAQKVAAEVEVIITPREKQLLEKPPSTSLTALDYYLQANEEYWRSAVSIDNREAMNRAETLARKALTYDPAFSKAYSLIAWISFRREQGSSSMFGTYYSQDYFDPAYVDSVRILTDLALDFDDENVDALNLSSINDLSGGRILQGKATNARALQINPNDAFSLLTKGIFLSNTREYGLAFTSYQQAINNEKGLNLPLIYKYLASDLNFTGFPDECESVLNRLLALKGDSVMYCLDMRDVELKRGNSQKAERYVTKAYELDSTRDQVILSMGDLYYYNHQYSKAYGYYHSHFNYLREAGWIHPNYMHRMAHVLWELDRKEEARNLFQQFIGIADLCVREGNIYAQYGAQYDLAGVYSFLSEKEKAYANLNDFLATSTVPFHFIAYLKERDPLFENIRHEERFRQILSEAEARFQADHEMIRQWLEENELF